MKEKDYEYLAGACKSHPYLVHAKNIIGKYKDRKNAKKIPVLDLFANRYLSYLKGNLALLI